MNFFIYVGLFASIFGLTTQLPQIFKMIKTKSAKDLSYGTISIYMANQISWFLYAMYVDDIIYSVNAAGHFVIGGVELILKAHYDKINSLTEPS
tara:strand:- start:2124 stop:2405 length:282 start_codon:yes stop_codon:yes gene_type:complete